MTQFNLSHKAIEDLSKIWEERFKKSSENQADMYYNMLILTCKKLSEKLTLGKEYHVVSPSLLGIKINEHLILVRTKKEATVEIIRIIHKRMALEKLT